MSKVFIEMSISLDGYIARPDISKEHPFGIGGKEVYAWAFAKATETDTRLSNDSMEAAGAVIAGNGTYKIAIDDAWEGVNPFSAPVFVLSHNVPDHVVDGFTFVSDGIESALAKAKAAAGHKDVWVMGGANVAQQFIKDRLIDELHIHIAPLFLGVGIRLFENIGNEQIILEHGGLLQTPGATHLTYRVKR